MTTGYLLLSKNYIINERESYAVAATTTISVICHAPTITAFVPDVLVTFSLPEPVASTAPAGCKDYSISLTRAVNGDGAPQDTTCDLTNVSGEYYIQISYPTPRMKIAGLQCNQVSSASLDVYRNGPESGVRVYFERPDSVNPVHEVTEIAAQMFGKEGYIGKALRDGEDDDGYRNGEIVFGGRGEKIGGSKTILFVDITNSTGNYMTNVNLDFSPER